MSEELTDSAALPRYVLRLFVAGMTPRSQRAIANLRRICDEQLAGRVDIATIDIFQQPHLAEKHQVVAAPTLLRLEPLPVKRLIGDLSDEARVLSGLDLPMLPWKAADGR